MSELAKTIGQRIKYYRCQLGLSQEKVAEKAGCHTSYIGQLERGDKNATIKSIEKIAQIFDRLGSTEDPDTDSDIPAKCYDLLLSKSKAEQEQLYQILLEMDKYKNMPM